VKDEGSNLTKIMTNVFKSIIKCEVLSLDENFQCTCFGHIFFKHVSMLQVMKRITKAFNLFLLSLPS